MKKKNIFWSDSAATKRPNPILRLSELPVKWIEIEVQKWAFNETGMVESTRKRVVGAGGMLDTHTKKNMAAFAWGTEDDRFVSQRSQGNG